MRFRFNPRLFDDDYQLPAEALQSLAEHASEIAGDRDRLVELSNTAATMFPDLLRGNTNLQREALREARCRDQFWLDKRPVSKQGPPQLKLERPKPDYPRTRRRRA